MSLELILTIIGTIATVPALGYSWHIRQKNIERKEQEEQEESKVEMLFYDFSD